MKAHQKGFTVIEILVVVAIVGLLIAVGWLFYDRQSNTISSQQSNTDSSQKADKNPDDKTKKQETLTTLLNHMGVKISTVSIPDGWKTYEDCEADPGVVLLLPPEKDSVRCGSEDFGIVVIRIKPIADIDAISNCDGATDKRNREKQFDGFVSYDCQIATLDKRQAVKEIYVQDENAIYGATTYTSYTFILPGELAFKVGFDNPKSMNKPAYTNTFNEFVGTLRIQ